MYESQLPVRGCPCWDAPPPIKFVEYPDGGQGLAAICQLCGGSWGQSYIAPAVVTFQQTAHSAAEALRSLAAALDTDGDHRAVIELVAAQYGGDAARLLEGFVEAELHALTLPNN